MRLDNPGSGFRPVILLLLCLFFVIVRGLEARATASDDGPPSPQPQAGYERFKILFQRNIFSKERGRRRDEFRAEKTDDSAKEKAKEAPPARPEAEILLIGIVQKDGVLAAFFENSKTGAVQIVKQGGAIARGKIAAITFDGIEYACEGASSIVNIGKNLDGGITTRTAESKTTATGTDSGSSEVNAILERMRKKRQEEMKK